MVNDFEDYFYGNLENKNTLAIKMRTNLTETATESCSSNLYLVAFKNAFHLKMSVNVSIFQSSSNECLFRYISRIFISVLMLHNSFSLKHLSMATGNF